MLAPVGFKSLWVVACLAVARLAVADPASQSPLSCQAAGPQEARVLADKLFEKGEYQHAGACYRAAGDIEHANLAFLKAVGPEGEDTARALRAQRDAAKSQLADIVHAYRTKH
jgi:hypothetical protein